MSELLRAELLKLRTTRTFLALAGTAVGLSLLVVVLATTLAEPEPGELATSAIGSDSSSLFVLILGVVGITGEWRHRTITSSLLAAPDRIRFLVAKVIAYAVAGTVLSLLINVLTIAVGSVILAARGLELPSLGDSFESVWRALLLAALLGALGVGVGALVRNQVVAVVGVIVLLFVVEPALSAFAPDVGRFGPFAAAGSAVDERSEAGDIDLGEVASLGQIAGLLVILGWIALTTAAGALLLRRRDLSG